LLSDYNTLFGQYQSILSVLEEPLTSPDIPTISQVQFGWLSSDDTDTYTYVGDVRMCGDYSAMLMVRAKEMNWRMRIACMFYSHSGDIGYSDTDPYGEHGHAFNMILCQDGSDPDSFMDVYYIEPQNDLVWYVNDGSGNHVHYEIYTYMAGGLTGLVMGSNYWIIYLTAEKIQISTHYSLYQAIFFFPSNPIKLYLLTEKFKNGVQNIYYVNFLKYLDAG